MNGILKEKMRRRWDSNPRYVYHVYTLSRRAPSATRTLLLEEEQELIRNSY